MKLLTSTAMETVFSDKAATNWEARNQEHSQHVQEPPRAGKSTRRPGATKSGSGSHRPVFGESHGSGGQQLERRGAPTISTTSDGEKNMPSKERQGGFFANPQGPDESHKPTIPATSNTKVAMETADGAPSISVLCANPLREE